MWSRRPSQHTKSKIIRYLKNKIKKKMKTKEVKKKKIHKEKEKEQRGCVPCHVLTVVLLNTTWLFFLLKFLYAIVKERFPLMSKIIQSGFKLLVVG